MIPNVTDKFARFPIHILNEKGTGEPVHATYIFDVTERAPNSMGSGWFTVLAFVRHPETNEPHFHLCSVVKETEEAWRCISMGALRSIGDVRTGVMTVSGEAKDAFPESFIFTLKRFGLTREQYMALVEECLALIS